MSAFITILAVVGLLGAVSLIVAIRSSRAASEDDKGWHAEQDGEDFT